MSTDTAHMRRALELAARARGRTSPNPMVGCVIARNGAVVAEGFHERAGGPHAEVTALEAAGDVHDATLYVTLEPCAHHGKTPPCADLLIERRPARVVVAMEDPNPLVSGKGIAALREAGIPVEVGLLADEARRLNEIFVKFITTGMPFVIAKCAMSLDGKIATRTGHSRWVTGETSRAYVHQLRNELDAILVGSRTVMLDDPSLTTRIEGDDDARDPIRIILDADDYLDASRRIFHTPSGSPTWVVLPENRAFDGADDVLHVPMGPEGMDMVHLMRQLGERGVASVLIEGGGATLASAFESSIVDKVMFFVAPKIIGGVSAVTAVEGYGIETMDDAVLLENMTARPMGEDILIEAYVKRN